MIAEVICSCGVVSPKYKCPVCRTPYCSVQCCREHKSKVCTPPPVSEETIPEKVVNPCFPTEDTLLPEKLQNLRHNSKIHEYLSNPHLRHIMNVIDKSNNPTDLIAQAMLEPIFVEFATECLKVIEGSEDNNVNLSDEG